MKTQFVVLAFVLVLLTGLAHAQQKPAPIAPAERLKDGWEEIDQRLIFLMVRLANTETSLDAVENAIAKNTTKKGTNSSSARRAELDSEHMDRKGGGPVEWSKFYGRTAEKFFYHPTDRNSTYHTTTVLSQQSPEADNKVAEGVPSRQGLPVHQRPPQFDYIYRANEKAKGRAEKEAAELGNKIDALLKRRKRLETEQSALWCEVAFRAVSHYDLDKKPMYRFEPLVTEEDKASKQRAEIMKAAASFMRVALSIIDAAQKDQATTFSKIKPAVSDARQKLSDAWLRQAVDTTDRRTTVGKVAALAKLLDEVASNLSESYVISIEGDREKDQQRKETFRGLLQESLVRYAQIVLALDEMLVVMEDKGKFKPDLDKPFSDTSLANVATLTRVPTTKYPKDATKIEGNHYKVFWASIPWDKADGSCKQMGGKLAIADSDAKREALANLKGQGKVVWLGGRKRDGKWKWINGEPVKENGKAFKVTKGNKSSPGWEGWDSISFSIGNELAARPNNGKRPAAVEMVQGFICEWDD